MMGIRRNGNVMLLYLYFFQSSIGQKEEDKDWNTCAERCEESYFPGRPCYCNQACSQYENCCYDYIMLCQPELATNDSWTSFNGHSYKYFPGGTLNARQASQECRDEGGLLLSINTEQEFVYVTNEVLRKRTLSAFIGGTDLKIEGSWTWADETPMPLSGSTWHAWFPGEPDNAGGVEHCSAITNYMFWAIRKQMIERYVWRDYSCEFNPSNEIQGYICERTLMCDSIACQNGGSCIYVPGPEEFECACQTPFVGDRCQYKEIKGEEWIICGETNLTESSGIIRSPLYPKPYPANARCKWLITTEENRTLSISINEVEIEPSKHCWLDHLIAYEGSDSNSSILFGPFCGSQSNSSTNLVQNTYISSAKQVLIEFSTDEDIGFGGFSLMYTQAQCGQGVGHSGCGIPQLYTSSCGELRLVHGQQSVDNPCEFQISVPPNTRINLTVLEFKTIDTGLNCKDGGLILYDGPTATSPVLLDLCGFWTKESLFSSSNSFLLQLRGLQMRKGDIIHLFYETFDADITMRKEPINLSGEHGRFEFNAATDIFMRHPNITTYRWLIQVPYGDNLIAHLNFTLSLLSIIKIYKGQESTAPPAYTWNDTGTHNETVEIRYFKALIELSEVTPTTETSLEIFFEASEWLEEESGCVKPFFRDDMQSATTTNNMISVTNPVMILISDIIYDVSRPGYSSGLYCQWHLKSKNKTKLSIDLLEFNIHPKARDCRMDGFLALTPDRSSVVFGPFCGSDSIQGQSIEIGHSELILIFYSDPAGEFRENGKIRALVHVNETGNRVACPILHMTAPSSEEYAHTCGIILSPNFPGHVQPGLWFWSIAPPEGSTVYFDITLYYVRGPAVKDDECEQSFKLIEIPNGADALRQYEADMLTLCGDTDLFQPSATFKLPPKQKFGIQLRTLTNSLPQRWEFKLFFQIEMLMPPRHYEETGGCPSEYMEWRGYCYGHYPWILRHYAPEDYSFQTTWQTALEKCESENSTLLSIYDDEEAYFIKYMLATRWFWDEIAPLTVNHRLIYLGLHNRQHNYEWTTGVNLGFSDWYRPKPRWSQSPVYEDSFLSDIVNFDLKQPSADASSLCSGFLSTSPHTSMNWIKIPCDYPLFRAGVICKQPIGGVYTGHNSTNEILDRVEVEINPSVEYTIGISHYSGCEKGWFMMDGNCYLLYSNYVYINESEDVGTSFITLDDATSYCSNQGAEIPNIPQTFSIAKLKILLHIWNHTELTGTILIGLDMEDNCSYIMPRRRHDFDVTVYYEHNTEQCRAKSGDITSVLCVLPPTEYNEQCRGNEFRCANGMCISSDFVCDSSNDCKDNSDEYNCNCGESFFRCNNGDCVSVSLRCDFIPHCLDGSDEAHCALDECGVDEFRCANGQCINDLRVCDRRYNCMDGTDEDPALCAGRCNGFQCYSGLCLDTSLRQDGMTDCAGQTAEDEAEQSAALLTLFGVYYGDVQENMTSIYGCRESGTYTNCRQGESPCYDRSEACVYDTVMHDEIRAYRTIKSCRAGAQLRQACVDVECPGLYHCQESYCIPPEKLCDAHIDCPHADDELNCDQYVCPGMFRCKGSHMCLPHSKVCDDTRHCALYGEDEKYCTDRDPLCYTCTCDGHIAYCEDLRLDNLPNYYNINTRELRAIFADHNAINVLQTSTFRRLHWLSKLNLSHNKITKLNHDIFMDLSNLIELDLSYNRISFIKGRAFKGLTQLKVLNLNDNKLKELRETYVKELVSLDHLMIKNNDLGDVKGETFAVLPTLKRLNSDEFKICCVAPNVDICTPEADEFSSCDDLMSNSLLQVFIWILGVIALIGNAFVVAWRMRSDPERASSIFVINLGCSDFLMGVYLIIIASVDVNYRGMYIEYSDTWRNSWLCQLAGVMATLSSEVSVFMLTTMTIERCITVLFPLKLSHLSAKRAKSIAGLGWLVCLFLSVLPLSKLPAFGDAFYGRTGVCLPFIVSNEKLPGWEYSAFIFLGLNFVSFIVIFFGYLTIFGTVKSNIDSIGASASNVVDEYALAKKLSLIVGSDFACWVPIILIGFAALGGATIDPDVSAWIAVFVLPLNSALNPIIYTLSAIDCGRAKRRRRTLYSGTTEKSQTATTVASSSEANVKRAVVQGPDKTKPHVNVVTEKTRI